MELWVRTQDKDKLVKIEYVQYVEGYDPIDEYDGFTTNEIWANEEEVELGQYKTKERCLEIIDEIQKLLLSANPKEAFMLLKNIESDDYDELNKIVQRARVDKFLPYCSWGDENASIEVIQPSVLVYEMPKE